MTIADKLKDRFDFIYGGNYPGTLIDELEVWIDEVKATVLSTTQKWSGKDVVLITYGDSIVNEGEKPLNVLGDFLKRYIGDVISYVHILPFFPYSSDDGFSVIDYMEVNPELGDWEDISELRKNYKLMFDLVINHISQHSEWYKNYKQGIAPGKGYFVEVDPDTDLSKVVRPRSLPLLTPVTTPEGHKHVWTTFSEDQIDLNFSEPQLMVEMIKVFLFYLEKGASMVRLDAIAFLWKEIGTNCLHLPQTHEFVKLLRDITDYISEDIILLTETNVPNKENLSYFGNNDEANMVYQFSLPPLLLHALFTGNSEYLASWANTIPELPKENTFFNFTASHDGIGVRPLEGLVPKAELAKLVSGMEGFGGKVNTKRNSDGTDSPYELNITYFDSMKGTFEGEDSLQEERFICSQTIMMSMKGVPAFYIHSLLGTKNYVDGIAMTGMNRTINRRKWDRDEIYELLNKNTHHKRILDELMKRIGLRIQNESFHPDINQSILGLGSKFFGLIRGDYDLIALFNVTSGEQKLSLKEHIPEGIYMDLLSGETVSVNSEDDLQFSSYQAYWLIPKE